MSMSLRHAERLASFIFGPSGQVKRHQEPKNRHKRFAVYFTGLSTDKPDYYGRYPVYVAGWGDSFDAAFKMANENPFAQQKAKEIVAKRKELSEKIAEAERKQEKEGKTNGKRKSGNSVGKSR